MRTFLKWVMVFCTILIVCSACTLIISCAFLFCNFMCKTFNLGQLAVYNLSLIGLLSFTIQIAVYLVFSELLWGIFEKMPTDNPYEFLFSDKLSEKFWFIIHWAWITISMLGLAISIPSLFISTPIKQMIQVFFAYEEPCLS